MLADPVFHIVKPNLAVPLSAQAHSPIKVNIQSSALLQLIESIYQDDENDKTKSRTVGTLLGVRSDDGSSIEIKESYIVPHNEEDDELRIEEAFHITSYQLLKRISPELQVVGWFSTNAKFDDFTGLLNEFYGKGSCAPHAPIHLTLQCTDEKTGEIISPIVKTYISSPVGLPASSGLAHQLGLEKIGATAFTPIPNEVIYTKNQLNTLKFLNKASSNTSTNSVKLNKDELRQFSQSISEVSSLVEVLQSYVQKVIAGEIEGDESVGKFLLTNLNFKAESIDVEYLKKAFEQHINDSLLVEYLASCIKQQLDASAKLTNFISPEEAVN
ncbi:unnamed protein product [Ambrosiozyma monospora]|uniref:Unnamed protein product n=1 Tax=Ambrosiozyma monospora TaxID=43982 RepID=A0A9W6Z1C7_AMBMO|nr:unnamed protein product [Ambrosiozyma monospora]